MNEDGTDPTQLTSVASGASRPSWSSDGSRLAFDDAGEAIYVVEADGSGLMRFAPRGAFDPTWSPDGSRIAFTDQNHSIFTMNLEGADVRRISEATVPANAPSWGLGSQTDS